MTKDEFSSWLLKKHNEEMKGYDEARKIKCEATDLETEIYHEALQDWHVARKNFAEDILVKLNEVRW